MQFTFTEGTGRWNPLEKREYEIWLRNIIFFFKRKKMRRDASNI